MVKRYDPTGESFLYGAMKEALDDGDYVLHSDYAALAASHARLLVALSAMVGYVADDHDDTSLLDNDALWAQAIAAIAAAQPFAEK
jgi:hypothetical protein